METSLAFELCQSSRVAAVFTKRSLPYSQKSAVHSGEFLATEAIDTKAKRHERPREIGALKGKGFSEGQGPQRSSSREGVSMKITKPLQSILHTPYGLNRLPAVSMKHPAVSNTAKICYTHISIYSTHMYMCVRRRNI